MTERKDVLFRTIGVGAHYRFHCLGCDRERPVLGSKGQPNLPIWRRCAVCVAAKAKRAVDA